MRVQPTPQKPKYQIKDYAILNNQAVKKVSYVPNDGSCKQNCICDENAKGKTRECFRCHKLIHSCVLKEEEENFKKGEWQCLQCLSRLMDPIESVGDVLLETYYRTQHVFQYANHIEFLFYLNRQQISKPVEIRGLKDGRTGLAWPMHGSFYLRSVEEDPFIDFKPLLTNSNRKHRKEDAIILPPSKLVEGLNTLIFSIPKLNSTTFSAKYQVQKRDVYFIGIYSINKLSKEELINKTIKTSRIQKPQSLKLLKELTSNDAEMSIEKIKLCLECPYTKCRIKIPVRGKKCTHYMCLCLDTLIQTRTNMKSRDWACPICNSRINEPVIDMFILEILNDGSAGIEVMLSANGDYNWISFDQNQIDLDSDDGSEPHPPLPSSKLPSVTPPPQSQPPQRPPQSQIAQKMIPQNVIEIDDDSADNIPRAQAVNSQSIQNKPNLQSSQNKSRQMPPPNFSLNTLQIMVPDDISIFNKQKQIVSKNEQLKEAIKEQKEKKTDAIKIPRKQQELLITDIKEIEFKPMSNSEFTRRYFKFDYARVKPNDELGLIFKEVL